MALFPLLTGAKEISSLRDRHTATAMASAAIGHLLAPVDFAWYRTTADKRQMKLVARQDGDKVWINDNSKSEDQVAVSPEELRQRYPAVDAALRDSGPAYRTTAGGLVQLALPTFRSDGRIDSLLLAERQWPLTDEQIDGVGCFLQFYGNYLSLLDYGELDTLTGLHNRKTFDDTLDQWLQAPGSPEGSAPNQPTWLAVLDIDHFKQINDTWGHLFGDETLLRFSRLLKDSFRSQDRLFRFGGEEFIVILRAPDRDRAWDSLERFRRRLERTEFPQVGQVTCSIGFACLDPTFTVADLLGRADQALYFAKHHGRNQTRCYETLVEQAQLAPSEPLDGQHNLDFDIDQLFS